MSFHVCVCTMKYGFLGTDVLAGHTLWRAQCADFTCWISPQSGCKWEYYALKYIYVAKRDFYCTGVHEIYHHWMHFFCGHLIFLIALESAEKCNKYCERFVCTLKCGMATASFIFSTPSMAKWASNGDLLYPVSPKFVFNPLKPELNPICYLLALLGAHHFLHVSRIRVKLLTFRLLMS